MTTVNWEVLDGGVVERFVASLLLLENPHGNLITPSKGDRGVDIQIEHPDGGYDIYQVKRYTKPLTTRQKGAVKDSWETFVAETFPGRWVRSWTLVTPWDPSNPALDWLAELTADQTFPTHWMGRAALDGKAGNNPRLVDYFFGDGAARLYDLLTQAMHGGSQIETGLGGQGLLDAVVSRHATLEAALNEADPYYTYRIEVRPGHMDDGVWTADHDRYPSAVLIEYKGLGQGAYAVLWTLPRAAESTSLRPISTSLVLEPAKDSPELQAVHDYIKYGAPFQDVPATITASDGPPGLSDRLGAGQVSFMIPSGTPEGLPELEVRLVTGDESVLQALPVVDARFAQGLSGEGHWIFVRDPSGVLEFEFLVNGSHDGTLRITPYPLTGKTPAAVLPAVRMVSAFAPGFGILLAVREGPPVSDIWALGAVNRVAAEWGAVTPQVLEALRIIQRHTAQRVVIPKHLESEDLKRLLLFSQLLEGKQVETSWSSVSVVANADAGLSTDDDREFRMWAAFPMIVRIGGSDIILNRTYHVLYENARLGEYAPDGRVTLVPGANTRAIVKIDP